MNKDIAIIGMAGRFPEAANLHEFYQNLRNGRDSVREVSAKRIEDTALPADLDYQVLGYLEDIDKFDHKFFNISMVEAQNMDPQQRQALEVAYETFESAGYSIDHFYNSRTAVYVSGAEYQYQKLVDIFEPTAFSGNTHYTTAGRISRAFHLRGAAAVTDTGCSSALVAVAMGCNEIWLGNADYALACGVRLIAFPALKKLYIDVGITSKDGKTKSFADDSYGSGSCETVGAILLKPLEKALEDKDMIYAVIKGAAMNQNGQLSGSLTATSSVAQAEAIREAWKKSGIDPLTISYIEAHGSGTKLGDPIEISGIDMAFREFTDKKNFCAVSSVKTNIGHTDTAAGMAGIIKAALSVHYKELFPSLHFEKPNPFIDFANSATYVNTELRKWELSEAVPVRRAGVNSFGFAGNNTHVVLEEPQHVEALNPASTGEHLITVSSKTAQGLSANIAALKNYIAANPSLRLEDISYTLTKGRKHYDYRFATTVSSVGGLLAEFDKALQGKKASSVQEVKKHVFLFSGDTGIPAGAVEGFQRYPAFKESYAQCRASAEGSTSSSFETFAFQYSFCRLLESFGLCTENVLGLGLGEITVSAVLNEIPLQEAVSQALRYRSEALPELSAKLLALVEAETQSEKALFIEMGGEGHLSRSIRSLDWPNSSDYFEVLSLGAGDISVNELLKSLFLLNYNIAWPSVSMHGEGRKTYLPAYQFEKTRCWLDPYKGGERLAASHPAYYLATVVDPNITKSKTPVSEVKPNLVPLNLTAGVDTRIDESWTDTQKKIVRIWGQILKLEKIGLDDDFFKLGGHSLFGVQVTNRIEKEFGVKLQFKDIVSFSTIRLLSHGVDNLLRQKNEGSTYSTIELVPEQEYYALSNTQRRLWVVDQLEEGGNLAYNLPGVVLVEGNLDKEHFENTFRTIVRRHEILRTTFEVRDGEPVQVVHPGEDFRIAFSSAEEKDLDAVVNAFICPFDLQKGPLMRIGLVQLAPQRYALLLDMHHIIADGTSMTVMIKEFFALYNRQQLPEQKTQYKDFAAWQNRFLASEEMQKQERFWLEQFSDEPPVLSMPLDYPRPAVQSFEGAELYFTLNPELSSRLRNMARETGTTLYMLMLAAYNVLLSRYSGDEDIVVGSPVAGRSHTDLESMLGVFINTLAFRNRPLRGKSFLAFLEDVKHNALQVYQHQEYPFETLVSRLDLKRDMSRNPLFDTMFLFQNMVFGAESNLQGITFTPYQFEKKTSQFDLTLEVKEQADDLAVRIEYCTRLFRRKTIERFRKHFTELLETITSRPDTLLGDISLVDEREQSLLDSWSHAEGDPGFSGKTFTSLLEAQAASLGAKAALVAGSRSYTYAQLNSEVNRVAHYLRKEHGVKPNDRVGIALERSEWLVIAMLGVIKAGAAYVPVDPAYPSERMSYIASDSGMKLLLRGAQQLAGVKCSQVDITAVPESLDISNPDLINDPDDLIYAIYTSGSTGNPKGVKVQHRNIAAFTQNLPAVFGIQSSDTVLALTSVTFDISVLELLCSLANGSTVVLADEETIKNPSKTEDLIREQQVTVVQLTPSRLKMLFTAASSEIFSRVKVMLVGGEPLPEPLFKRLKQLSGTAVYNVYGPTETTIWSTASRVEGEVLTIGRPLPSESVYILSDDLKPRPVGIYGEICIGGAGVTAGYIGNEELTRSRFVTYPGTGGLIYRTGDTGRWTAEGTIEFAGRKDHQVKVRGYRIELGEIEAGLVKHPSIKDAAVLAKEDAAGDKFLAAFVVLNEEKPVAGLKAFLAGFLPEYMIPSHFVVLESFTLTTGGKIDRKMLASISMDQSVTASAYVAPAGEMQEKVAAVFAEVLGTKAVGAVDSFFELGGHSLKATSVAAKIYQKLGREITLRDVFRYPTVKALSEYLENTSAVDYTDIPVAAERPYYPLSFGQRRLYVLQQFKGADTVYNMSGALEIEGPVDAGRLESTFAALVSRHESFRTSFELVEGEPVQRVHRDAVFAMERLDGSGKTEQELKEMVNNLVRPFDLAKAPLLRASLIRVSDSRHIVFYDMNHLVSDGTSMGIFVGEFIRTYEGAGLPALRLQYKDYVLWQEEYFRSEAVQKQKSFWLEELKDAARAELPSDKARPQERQFSGERIQTVIGSETLSALKSLSSETGATLYMILLSAYNVLVSRYSGVEDVTVGSPAAGRPHADLAPVVGMFVNTLALRNHPSKHKPFAEFLSEVKANSLKALENQDYPFEVLVEELGLGKDKSRNPLFDTVLAYQNMAMTSETISGLTFRPFTLEQRSAKFDITWEVIEAQGQLEVNIEYNSSLFRKATIEQLFSDLEKILSKITADRNVKIGDIDFGYTVSTIEKGTVQEFDFEF